MEEVHYRWSNHPIRPGSRYATSSILPRFPHPVTNHKITLGFIYFASYTYFTSTYWPTLPNFGKCAGEEFAAISGMCIITSYLFLFLGFYFATYKKPVPKGRRRATSALVEMKDEKVPTVGEARRRLSTSRAAGVANGVATGASLASTPNGRATRSRKA